MKIGELARKAGSNSETVRYYERIGLLPRPGRTRANYRDYSVSDVERLSFIRHARGLGFELADIRCLIGLAEHPDRDCGEVDAIASHHLAAVETKIAQLSRLRRELARMLSQCRGGTVSSCRILQVMADHDLCSIEHS